MADPCEKLANKMTVNLSQKYGYTFGPLEILIIASVVKVVTVILVQIIIDNWPKIEEDWNKFKEWLHNLPFWTRLRLNIAIYRQVRRSKTLRTNDVYNSLIDSLCDSSKTEIRELCYRNLKD